MTPAWRRAFRIWRSARGCADPLEPRGGPCLSQMMNRMDGINTRKRDLDLSSRNQKGEAVARRVDVLPLITFDKTTMVDEVSGKTRVEFVRAKSEFRFSACR